ncbi:hypothetical protein B296_00051947 [Ensete ventricosum]|uniref:ATP-cone domain-containing protein n=1 Tax=Ensete ventricosum TaxID=4639 RepID=A0A426XDD8_ENSVE|nr:hypothetical protein B296_00051947 [Ensete ventricosum]
MYVVKRDGRHEAVHFDKITARLKKLSYGLSQEHCDPVLVAQKVCAGVYKGVITSQLDELAAETAAAMTSNHPDYASVIPASCSSSLNLRTLLYLFSFGKVEIVFPHCLLACCQDCGFQFAQEHKEVIFGNFAYLFIGFCQLSSCFLICMKEDSIEGIYDTLKECAIISKSAGGIGVSVHNIRATGSYIRGTNGTSNGIVPMLRVFNDTARYVDQGGGKRKGNLVRIHLLLFSCYQFRKLHC